jgi:CheY-like chemotaxis protein/nitrogen-specific signal transduction histidine kinase
MLARNHELEALVRQRTAELERTSAAKDEFVASISHEIRNPLNGVIGLAAALGDSELAPTQRHQLGMMRQCANHLSSLIEDILDFAKIEAGEIAIDPERFDVQDLCESVRSVMHEKSAALHLPIDLAIDTTVPPILVGDKRRIRQILLNYVGNALNYAGRGRIMVAVRAVPREGSSYEVVFTVTDEGPGIPTSEQGRLFVKFKRGGAARRRNVGGAGLGLAVSRSLAERMGGSVGVESEVGEGASFFLRLPLTRPADRTAAAAPSRNPIKLPGPAFVVDDMEFNSAGLVAMLQHLGISAEVAASGEEALEKIASMRYFMIFVDCDLPGMSGLDLARAIRLREQAERVVIIATTAYATQQVADHCRAAGMDGFLSKPITLDRLRAAIGDRIAAGRAAAPVHFADSEDPPGLPFKLEILRYMANDDPEALARQLRGYVRELDAYVEELRVAIQVADFQKLRKIGHKLVSHLAVVQHADLLDLAQQLQESAVNRDIRGAAARLVEINSGLRAFRPQILAVAADARAE